MKLSKARQKQASIILQRGGTVTKHGAEHWRVYAGARSKSNVLQSVPSVLLSPLKYTSSQRQLSH